MLWSTSKSTEKAITWEKNKQVRAVYRKKWICSTSLKIAKGLKSFMQKKMQFKTKLSSHFHFSF